MSAAHCNRSRARRGSVYAMTLLTSMFVMTIGMSAILASRIHARQMNGSNAVVEAGFASKSYVEIVLFRLSTDGAWRSRYINDTWSAEESLQDVRLSFKLIDDKDGNLADDPEDPVRLVARARVRGAVRMWSVEVESIEAKNLLVNGDMEAGFANWSGEGPVGTCTLVADTAAPYDGLVNLQTSLRSGMYAGPHQDVTPLIREGRTYYLEVYLRGSKIVNDNRVGIIFTTSTGIYGTYFDVSWSGFDWEQVSGTITPTWSGTLIAAHWKVDTPSGSDDFALDDAVLIEGGSRYNLAIVSGSWRREVE